MKYLLVILIIIEVVFGITNYSFTNDAIDYVILEAILILLTIGFFKLSISTSIKILTTIIGIIGIGLLGYWFYPMMAMAKEEIELINTWNADRYEIHLTKRIGFAGPPYYRYDIDKQILFGLLEKDIDERIVGAEEPVNCEIDFTRANLSFDRCKNEFKNAR